ncbi:MAG: tetraacyldisaccharide 4'-kinase, partial [candidate division Zixibacteria bacterium]|nr:tetraacyldisaccharide 4'-kinase [candidate division Zixibacteria bacterium]
MLEALWKRILRRGGISPWSIPAAALWLASLGYRLVIRGRSTKPKHRIKVPISVISIGNIAVGGSGKTPMVKLLAQSLIQSGLRVGIVSSGYRRSGVLPLIEDGRAIAARAAEETGDEVNMLARDLPYAQFAVHPSKSQGAHLLAEKGNVDVIIVDDGFQHLKLHRDLDVVTFDAAVPKAWLKLFPYGILREPLAALSRADLIVITRPDFAQDISELKSDLKLRAPGTPLYTARFNAGRLIGRNWNLPIKYLEDKSVLLFAGVGNFDSLQRQVRSLSGSLVESVELADHQRYDQPTLERLHRHVNKSKPDVVITTAKDWVKVGAFDFGREFYYLDLQVDLDPGEE